LGTLGRGVDKVNPPFTGFSGVGEPVQTVPSPPLRSISLYVSNYKRLKAEMAFGRHGFPIYEGDRPRFALSAVDQGPEAVHGGIAGLPVLLEDPHPDHVIEPEAGLGLLQVHNRLGVRDGHGLGRALLHGADTVVAAVEDGRERNPLHHPGVLGLATVWPRTAARASTNRRSCWGDADGFLHDATESLTVLAVDARAAEVNELGVGAEGRVGR